MRMRKIDKDKDKAEVGVERREAGGGAIRDSGSNEDTSGDQQVSGNPRLSSMRNRRGEGATNLTI